MKLNKKQFLFSVLAGLVLIIVAFFALPSTKVTNFDCSDSINMDCAAGGQFIKRGFPFAIVTSGPYTDWPIDYASEFYTEKTSPVLTIGIDKHEDVDTVFYPLGLFTNMLLWISGLYGLHQILIKRKAK